MSSNPLRSLTDNQFKMKAVHISMQLHKSLGREKKPMQLQLLCTLITITPRNEAINCLVEMNACKATHKHSILLYCTN